MYICEEKSREGQGFPRAGRAASWDFPRALPLGNPSEQPCQSLENTVLPSSFTKINPIYAPAKWYVFQAQISEVVL